MSEYNHENRCHECDVTGGHHYPGCTYEGTEGNYRYSSGSGDGMSTFGAILCVILLLIAFYFVQCKVIHFRCSAYSLPQTFCL